MSRTILRIAKWALLLALLCAAIYGAVYLDALYWSHSAETAVEEYPVTLEAAYAASGGQYLSYADIPSCAREGIVSVEDKRFFHHWGFDVFAAIRVLAESFRNDHTDHGGSTITQQLARLISGESRLQPTLLDEARSQFVILKYTMLLEHDFPKEKILELYLNSVYYGKGAQGIAAAATAYFGLDVNNISFGQCLYLTGLPQAPTVFGSDPSGETASERYTHVVNTMERNGYITPAQGENLAKEKLF